MSKTEEILKAAEEGDAVRVRGLLEQDSSLIDVKGDYDKTPLHWAAEKNHRLVAEVLLQAGANIEVETVWGMTPLEWAANMGSNHVADLLIGKGARLNMWAAAGLGLLDVVESFWESPSSLRNGAAQTRCREEPNGTWVKIPPCEDYALIVSDAFYIACRNGHLPIARFLLERGAQIDFRGFFGGTGLHWAAINGHEEPVAFLVEHDADINLRDEQFGSTPAGWARRGVPGMVAGYLLRMGASHEMSPGSGFLIMVISFPCSLW